MSSATVFFLEDAVRVGGSLPLHSVLRTATDAPTAGLAPPRLYSVRAVRAVVEGSSSSIVVCRSEAGGADHAAVVAYGCRAAATSSSGPARVYVVDVAGGRGDDGHAVVVTTVAVVCHKDTSRWDTGHVAFRLLGVKPGDAAVCHALPDMQVLAIENDEIIPVSL